MRAAGHTQIACACLWLGRWGKSAVCTGTRVPGHGGATGLFGQPTDMTTCGCRGGVD